MDKTLSMDSPRIRIAVDDDFPPSPSCAILLDTGDGGVCLTIEQCERLIAQLSAAVAMAREHQSSGTM